MGTASPSCRRRSSIGSRVLMVWVSFFKLALSISANKLNISGKAADACLAVSCKLTPSPGSFSLSRSEKSMGTVLVPALKRK